MIKFGPSGSTIRFFAEGYEHTEQMAGYVSAIDLDCYEYSFGRGVNLSPMKAASIKAAFDKENIEISVHAPYYVNLGTPDAEKGEKSYGYVLSSGIVGGQMGAKRVVFHPASQGKEDRNVVVERTKDRLKYLADMIYESGLDKMKFCPETMGKIAQIGTIEEITEFCKIAPFYYPTVDFGHVNAREQGSLKTEKDYLDRLEYMISELGYEKMKDFHVHFSKIMYSAKGEIKHLTFADTEYGPEFEPFIEA
ncbi:MAG: TIM barrel protein, partial [Clostridia bacterium]|nr:TIM barrel protein [Clostridia bacterium]